MTLLQAVATARKSSDEPAADAKKTLNCHRVSTSLKTTRRCIERGITLTRAAELFRPTVLSLF